jgi:hypothetical protein
MLRHGRDMTLGAAGHDDHGVRDAGFAGEIDRDRLDRLVVGQRRVDEMQQVRACWPLGRVRAYDGYSFLRARRPDPVCARRIAVPDS